MTMKRKENEMDRLPARNLIIRESDMVPYLRNDQAVYMIGRSSWE